MTIFRLFFAGEIKKAEHKTAAGKALVELSICKKNRTKDGEPESFTWARVSLWEPANFQAPKLIKGSFIAGSGEMLARSYTDKDGKNRVSIEVSCRSFDVEVSDGQPHTAPAPARPQKPDRAAASAGDPSTEEPPF